MKKLLLSLTLVASLSGFSQTTLFEDGFETYEDFAIDFAPWVNIDVDMLGTYTGGLPDGGTPWPNSSAAMAFQIFNPVAATVTNESDPASGEVRNFDPHTGDKYAACWAGVPAGAVSSNNDWLISPPVVLGTVNTLRFWVKSMSDTYGLEKYKVAIFVGAGAPNVSGAVTYLAGNPLSLNAPYPNWEEKVFALAGTYDNQTVRFGIRCVTSDAYLFMVDDMKVTGTVTAGVNDALSNKFSMFPNPANNVISISNADNVLVNSINITDINGRIVMSNNYNGVNTTELNVSALTSGVYFVNINTNEGVATKKLMKN